MDYRPLGRSGLLVSAVGLGCNNFGVRIDLDSSRAVIDAALDAGITLFDTADMYGKDGGSESALGAVLGPRREQVVLATKFGHQDHDMGYGPAAGAKGGRGYIRRAVEESLRRLRTDHIDLYQLHTPDPATPIAETLAALHELVVEGKVRYIGHSNLSGWQLAEAAHVARELGVTTFISAQNHYSLLDRDIEREVVPAAAHYGLGVLPYFPLAQGLLTGKVRRGEPVPEGIGWLPAGIWSPRRASIRWSSFARLPTSSAAACSILRSAGSRHVPSSGRSSPERPDRSRCTPTWRRGTGCRAPTSSRRSTRSRRARSDCSDSAGTQLGPCGSLSASGCEPLSRGSAAPAAASLPLASSA